MREPAVKYEVADRIAVITLNRPDKRNAINNDIAIGLRAAWERFNAGDERVAILTHAKEGVAGFRKSASRVSGGK